MSWNLPASSPKPHMKYMLPISRLEYAGDIKAEMYEDNVNAPSRSKTIPSVPAPCESLSSPHIRFRHVTAMTIVSVATSVILEIRVTEERYISECNNEIRYHILLRDLSAYGHSRVIWE